MTLSRDGAALGKWGTRKKREGWGTCVRRRRIDIQVEDSQGSAEILVAVQVAELPAQLSVTDPASEPSG